MNDYDNLVEASLSKAIQDHRDKSDADLEKIINHNYLSIHTTSDTIESAKMLGELKACRQILDWRQAEIERKIQEEIAIGKANGNWLLGLHNRKKKAVRNLPAATSYHGQLIAAILDEEDNLSAENIRQWSDELIAMDNDAYQKLLDALVDENILYINGNGNYSLLTLCLPSLFPTDPLMFIKIAHERDYHDRSMKNFLEFLVKKSHATENDWMELNEPYKSRSPYKWDNDRYQSAFNLGKRALQEYVKKGILGATPIPDTNLNCYYFPMLGEKEGV